MQLSESKARLMREKGFTHALVSRAFGYIALGAQSEDEARTMLSDGSVDEVEDCAIVAL